MTRRDLTNDHTGRRDYSWEAEDYIGHHADRLGLTFEQAAEIYEASRTGNVAQLHEMPDPEPEEAP